MFSFEDFDIKLDTDVIGRNFIYCEEVDSTNSMLLNDKEEYQEDGTVLLAEKQHAGRGRKDRKWYGVKDQNLTFSILLTRKMNPKKIGMLNFAASLAVAYSLENLFQLRTNLKWPNDVLIAGDKIAGILLEGVINSNNVERMVIGIGLNVNQTSFSGNFALTPTSIKKEIGSDVDRERLLSDLLNNFEKVLEKSIKKPQQVLSDWKARCRMLGEKIVIHEDNEVKAGIFEDVTEEGFLILKKEDNQLERIHYGDVSLR